MLWLRSASLRAIILHSAVYASSFGRTSFSGAFRGSGDISGDKYSALRGTGIRLVRCFTPEITRHQIMTDSATPD